jgi:nucleoside phosphorylase
MQVSIVTFNQNESNAVEALLDDLDDGNSPWGRDGRSAIKRVFGGQTWTISHEALLAQGNVVAAAELARQFQNAESTPDYVVFYGCAGALDPAQGASAFLVESVNYLSLGTVDPAGPERETVTLKNKWLCDLTPSVGVEPLPLTRFPLVERSSRRRARFPGLETARVAATDKVIHVGKGNTPRPMIPPPPRAMYEKEDWTYGEALAFVANSGEYVLVEMESYGIGRIAESLAILDHVIVLRVTTDSLTNHAKGPRGPDPQATLLMEGRAILGHLLACLFRP